MNPLSIEGILGVESLVFLLVAVLLFRMSRQKSERHTRDTAKLEKPEPVPDPKQTEHETEESAIEHLFQTDSQYEPSGGELSDSDWRRQQDQGSRDDRRGPGRF